MKTHSPWRLVAAALFAAGGIVTACTAQTSAPTIPPPMFDKLDQAQSDRAVADQTHARELRTAQVETEELAAGRDAGVGSPRSGDAGAGSGMRDGGTAMPADAGARAPRANPPGSPLNPATPPSPGTPTNPATPPSPTPNPGPSPAPAPTPTPAPAPVR